MNKPGHNPFEDTAIEDLPVRPPEPLGGPVGSVFRLPESDDYADTLEDCKVWQDKAAVTKPDFTGTLVECKKFVRSNPLLDDLFIDLPDGEQMAWNPHTYQWDML